MATIRTSIQMQDNMSGALRNMSGALENVINMFEQMQRAGNTSINPAQIQAARNSLGHVASSAQQVTAGLSDATQQQSRFNREVAEAENALGGVLGTITGIAGAYLSLQGVQQLLGTSDMVSNTTARLNMVNDGLQTTKELQDMIFASAERSRASYQDTADLVANLGLRAPEAFADNKQALLFGENLNKMFTIAGASQMEMASASLQLTQALGSGVLRGEEFNAVFEAAPNVIAAIAKYMGVTIGEMRGMAEDGELSATIVKNAMLSATDDINKKFAMMPKTFEQVFLSFKNHALFTLDQVWKKLSQIANSDGFAKFFAGAQNAIKTLGVLAIWALNGMSAVGEFLGKVWWIVGPVIGVVSVSLALLVTYLALAQGATLAMAAATWVMNAALWASPITWVVASIIALIGVFYVAINVINHFAGTSISATGIVMGAFASLGAYIYNVVATIWNILASVAEFLANVFINPVYSVKKLFADLAKISIQLAESMIGSFDSVATNLANGFIKGVNIAIGALNKLIGALNKIPGVEIGTVGEIGKRTSITGDLSRLQNKLNGWLGDAPTDYKELSRMDLKFVPDAFKDTYDKFGNKKKDSNDTSLESLLESIGELTDEGVKDGKDNKKNTKKMADKAGLLVDDLKYLRDLSEREAINRYTTASVKVDMNNNMNVNGTQDIDGIIDYMGQKVEEVAETMAGGGTLNV